jgi:hypothetical protein
MANGWSFKAVVEDSTPIGEVGFAAQRPAFIGIQGKSG